jgi:N-acetylglucosaminyl-diphospho-decaprenol L-rhamnosyltransferase
MPGRPVVDVVVVNWNTGEYLRDCLMALATIRQGRFSLGRVAIVDNASTDGSIARARDVALEMEIIENQENRGFAAACNQGAAGGDGEFVLFLNPDTRVTPEAIDRTVAFMLDPDNRSVGICGGRVVGESGNEEFSCSRFPTLWMVTAKMIGLSRLFPDWIPQQRVDVSELRTSRAVDQVIGAYFFMRRRLFEELGGFDERFFVYMEEVDLAYRSSKMGYSSYYLREATVNHVGRVSSDQVKGKRLFYSLRSRSEYARKHWRAWQSPVLAVLTVTVEIPVRFGRATVQGRRDDARAVREAGREYVRYLAARGATYR